MKRKNLKMRNSLLAVAVTTALLFFSGAANAEDACCAKHAAGKSIAAANTTKAAPATAKGDKKSSKTQQVNLTIDGGYEPETLEVVKGVPVTVKVDRKDASKCSEEIVIPEFGVKEKLPGNAKSEFTFTPTKTGTFEFHCGMGMMKGKLVVKDAAK